MELTVLGSGTAVPHERRAASAHWVQTSGGALLMDAGAAVVQRMAEERLDWPNLDAVWISHFHLDHLGGLAPFLFGIRHAPQMQSRSKPLNIYSAAGLEKLLRAMDEAGGFKLFKQKFPVQFREVEAGESFTILEGLRASVFKTPHTGESLALRLEDAGGCVLAYTSDTGYSPELSAFVRGASLLLIECSFPRDKPVEKHLELADAMRVAREAAPRRVVLTHLYPEWDGMDIEAEAAKLWNGTVIGARDGLRLRVEP